MCDDWEDQYAHDDMYCPKCGALMLETDSDDPDEDIELVCSDCGCLQSLDGDDPFDDEDDPFPEDEPLEDDPEEDPFDV